MAVKLEPGSSAWTRFLPEAYGNKLEGSLSRKYDGVINNFRDELARGEHTTAEFGDVRNSTIDTLAQIIQEADIHTNPGQAARNVVDALEMQHIERTSHYQEHDEQPSHDFFSL